MLNPTAKATSEMVIFFCFKYMGQSSKTDHLGTSSGSRKEQVYNYSAIYYTGRTNQGKNVLYVKSPGPLTIFDVAKIKLHHLNDRFVQRNPDSSMERPETVSRLIRRSVITMERKKHGETVNLLGRYGVSSEKAHFYDA